MKIGRPILFILINATSQKEIADLSQASAFLLSDLQQSSFDFAGHSKSDSFVLRSHPFAGDSRPCGQTS